MTERRNRMYFFHKHDEETTKQVQPLIELAKQYEFEVVDNAKHANIIVSVGGDGTFLQAVRKPDFVTIAYMLAFRH